VRSTFAVPALLSPLSGRWIRTRLKDRGGSTGSPNAHLRTPGPSPHRRSGRDKKADRADHGIRSRANTRRARTGALICPGRSHLPFRPGRRVHANVLLGRADGQFRNSTAPLLQIDEPSQVSGISIYPSYNRRLVAGASRQMELPGELNLLEVGYLRLCSHRGISGAD